MQKKNLNQLKISLSVTVISLTRHKSLRISVLSLSPVICVPFQLHIYIDTYIHTYTHIHLHKAFCGQ